MRHPSSFSRAIWAAAVVAVLFLAAPVAAQVPPPPAAPQVVLSPEATEVMDAALAGTMYEDLALEFRPFYFPSMQGGTLSMFGFRVGREGLMFGTDPFAAAAADVASPPPEVAKLELFAVINRDGTETGRVGTSFDLAKDGGDGRFGGTHSFGETLQPGSYEIVWGVRDTVSGKAGTRKDTFEVPDFMAGGLTTSSVLLVNGPPQRAPGTFLPNTVYDGIRVLTVLFNDDVEHVIDRATPEIMLTFIVVGAQMDATSQAFNIELDYRILNDQGKSIWRVPPQSLNRPTVGQPIPLAQIKGLDVGKEYRFEITAKDLVGATDHVTQVPFQIRE